jgi:hypothetical protein
LGAKYEPARLVARSVKDLIQSQAISGAEDLIAARASFIATERIASMFALATQAIPYDARDLEIADRDAAAQTFCRVL